MAFTVTLESFRPLERTHDTSQSLGGAEPREAPEPVPGPKPAPVPVPQPESWSGALAALGAFLRARRGSVSVGALSTVSAMVLVCGGLIAIAHEAHSQDRMDRAARAAARAIALLPSTVTASQTQLDAVICDVLRIEFDLDPQNDCSSIGPISVDIDLATGNLTGAQQPGNAGQAGEMILVRIGSGEAVIRREPTS